MKSNLKNSIVKLMVSVMIFTAAFTSTAFASQYGTKSVDVEVNGNEVEGGVLVDSTTFVPLREFVEAVGYGAIEWNANTLTASVSAPSLKIEASNGYGYIMANGRYFYNETPVYIENGIMFVPLRSISAAYNGTITWSDNNGFYAEVKTNGTAESADTFYNQDDLYWMSRIISAESRGEPLKGKIAVGNVVLNRVESDLFPDTVYDVIFDNKYAVQFTPTANGEINKNPTEESVIAAKICLEGYSISDDIIYFLNQKIATSTWIQNNRPYNMTIGNHDFYS